MRNLISRSHTSHTSSQCSAGEQLGAIGKQTLVHVSLSSGASWCALYIKLLLLWCRSRFLLPAMLSTRYTRIIAGRVEDSETRVCVGDTPLTYRIVWSGPGSAVSVPLRHVAISPPATRSIACSDRVRSTSSSPIPVCVDDAFPVASTRGRYNFYFIPFRNVILLMFTLRL